MRIPQELVSVTRTGSVMMSVVWPMPRARKMQHQRRCVCEAVVQSSIFQDQLRGLWRQFWCRIQAQVDFRYGQHDLTQLAVIIQHRDVGVLQQKIDVHVLEPLRPAVLLFDLGRELIFKKNSQCARSAHVDSRVQVAPRSDALWEFVLSGRRAIDVGIVKNLFPRSGLEFEVHVQQLVCAALEDDIEGVEEEHNVVGSRVLEDEVAVGVPGSTHADGPCSDWSTQT
mmetsp:Transcript_15984/g.34597  ORF Transcript_15984/g.34597 Transcript_15984/m.34597 type:complete len:226 (+) Transcript_15984:270-947(+)